MTTPRDLLIVAMDAESGRALERGDLSLALAGAELIDLLSADAVRLDGERIVPGYRPTLPDRLLDQAASSLVQQPPYESVDDWLWRRGHGLAAAYLSALEDDGELTREHHRWRPFGAGQTVLADSPARRRAMDRWTSREAVLTTLATAAGIDGTGTGDEPVDVDDAVSTVLAAVHDAVTELEAERQRRTIEKAAFDNIWRGDGT
ncbi:GPP34 family phosphoprotein [Streptomyces sp. RPA4-5]|uniref:GOLPH3/VPS74 family protein n=1 Tax=unclassified Streptomyces TaxID=2593676 RepID=UPI00143EB6FD|nr:MULTISPECIES: GPP34 family phosphoprotein [unclassified Streptomyces]QIY58832.1 GPP34 family phosphoprotein [Streptomyces sp. RPA4-5]WJY42113.1 GPP34 family phosphoprotein [Streptomyces sp. P9-2B-2]